MYENPFEERYIIIAEKPSVAMTIAAALGYRERKDGYIEGPDGIVTWCIGHLAEYAMPEEYDEAYRKWSLDALPIIPDPWKLVVPADKKKQFQIVSKLMNSVGESDPYKKEKSTLSSAEKFLVPFDYVVNACDAGREGELIFNRVYELSGTKLPVKRLWISSMEDDAIVEGFLNMKNGTEYKNLADASVCRAQADWLVGMNASRAFTKAYDHRLTVGRVQSPTLAMVVKRGEEIAGFRKQQYFITHLLVDSMGKTIDALSEHFTEREEANRLAGTCQGRMATVPSVEKKTRSILPPLPYDLTSLQRDANRMFGLGASKTLACAQALYENKLITYPRTDSKYLTDDMEKTAMDVASACRKAFPFLAVRDPGARSTDPSKTAAYAGSSPEPDVKRILDSKKVSDHHAIIPTVMVRNADFSARSEDEMKVLTLIAARLLCSIGKKHVYESVKASFLCCGYTFTASGKNVKDKGWKETETAMLRHWKKSAEDPGKKKPGGDKEPGQTAEETDPDSQDLSSLYRGAQFISAQTKVTEHWTQPPKEYTEDTLLHAMETAGASEMEDGVERKGLGTPATRASIIDKLMSSGYIMRKGRHLTATDAGRQLAAALPEYIRSPRMTADWENMLLQIERGQYDSHAFMDGITQMVKRLVQDCRELGEEEKKRFGGHVGTAGDAGGRESLGSCPVCGSSVYEGNRVFHCGDKDCGFVLWKKNRFLDSVKTSLTAPMVKDILAKGRTHVRGLYSSKKDKYFSADLIMVWDGGRASYRLEFTNRHKPGNT